MKKLKAFTIAETVIVMAIVGVMITVGFKAFNVADKNVRYIYANTFHSLDRALYSVMGTVTADDNPFSPKISATAGSVKLCELLTQYITPVEPKNVRCQSDRIIGLKGDSFGNKDTIAKKQFTAINGVRFYISKRYPDSLGSSDSYFYIIFADLNGDKKPNSMLYTKPTKENHNQEIFPDVFAFAALENGRICPIGLPEIDPRYMTARIMYQKNDQFDQDSNESNEVTYKYSDVSLPYNVAKAEAWGYYGGSTNAGYGSVPDTAIIEDNALTYNGYLRNKILSLQSNTIIYKQAPAGSLTVGDNVKLQKDKYNCAIPVGSQISDEECEVKIDDFAY